MVPETSVRTTRRQFLASTALATGAATFSFAAPAVAQRPKLDYGNASWISTLFSIRTTTTPGLLGEPALEGVHSDGVDHTMTTFLGSANMNSPSIFPEN